jgi:hypothetical protein
MYGWRISSCAHSTALNIGVGAILDTTATELRDGIKLDQALPSGETEVRTKVVSKWGFLLLASFSF